jgi:RsiW-degrading membrane proteinase PrsW (M82 family)
MMAFMEDQHRPECVIPLHKPSVREQLFFFVSGMLVSVPFALFFSQFYDIFPFIMSTVLFAPFIEELAKVFPLFYRHGETERSIVTLGILTGLGFGLTELFLYVFVVGVSPLARVPGVVFHASSAAITAYGIAKKKPLPYYLIAVALHIGNNFFAVDTALSVGLLAELLILIVVYYLAWSFYNRSSKEKIVT